MQTHAGDASTISDTSSTADLPQLKTGAEFAILETPEATWLKIWEDVKAALVRDGHACATRVRSIDKIAGLSGRWRRKDLICKCAGKSTSTPKVADPERRNATKSSRCDCTFKVKVSWNKETPPRIGKVCLEHVDECTAKATLKVQKNLVPPETIEEDCRNDIQRWTAMGMRYSEMSTLVSSRFAPLELGRHGRQKIRTMAEKVQQKMWSTRADATKLASSSKGVPGTEGGASSKRQNVASTAIHAAISSDTSAGSTFNSSAIVVDENESRDDTSNNVDLPELKSGTEFAILENSEATWSKIWEDVRAALVRGGHGCATNIRGISRMEDPSNRWQRVELVCKCARNPTSTPKVTNPARRRATASSRCGCTFKVKVSWNKETPPRIGKVCLDHVDGCSSEAMMNPKKNSIPPETIQEKCHDDIQLWTVAGTRYFDMYRLISSRFAPLELGPPGRRKIRTIAEKVRRELGVSLKGTPGTEEGNSSSKTQNGASTAINAAVGTDTSAGISCQSSTVLADDNDDENDTSDTAKLPQLKNGTEFGILENPEDTWSKIWEDVRAALVRDGHASATIIRGISRIDGPSSRWQRVELICKCARKSTSTPRVTNPEKRRATESSRCGCTFKVKVNWNKDTPPRMGKVCLDHVEGCSAKAIMSAKKNLVPPETIQEKCYDDIRHWTVTGLRNFDMCRFISNRFAPLELGPPGRQKIRNMAKKMQREMRSMPTDAMELVASLRVAPGTEHSSSKRQKVASTTINAAINSDTTAGSSNEVNVG